MVIETTALIIIGVLLNVGARLLSNKLTGIDAMPVIPIVIGYMHGSEAGLWGGAIVAVSYYVVRMKNIAYAPLTVAMSGLAGLAAGFFMNAAFVPLAVILLIAYHLVSWLIVSVFGVRGGYALFVMLNIASSLVLIYLFSLFA